MQLNNFQPVPQAQPETTPSPSDASSHPRKSAYAAMSDLREQFSIAGICTEQVWEFIKAQHSVDSRSLFTGKQWATIAAQLQSARRDDSLFKVFVADIPDHYFRILVYTDDPSVAIGRPRDMRKHHRAAEWGDFQQIADTLQCGITVKQGKRTTYFEPKRQSAPETRPLKPVIVLDTNARGEVLSPWGAVMERPAVDTPPLSAAQG